MTETSTNLQSSPGPAGLSGEALASFESEMRRLLGEALRFPSVSGKEIEFVRFFEGWARGNQFETDCWETDETEIAPFPQARQRHVPLKGRPTLVIRLPGLGRGRSLLFNAHSDVVSAGDESRWRLDPWSGVEEQGRFYGRGACDVKGPLISALWAMRAVQSNYPEGLPGDLILELIPGEEDCVGLGTLTSVLRGHRADGVIVLEPTDNAPCCASRGGCRFEITCRGLAVHGTLKWLGIDSISLMRRVLDALSLLEVRWNDREADPLFRSYPIARPVTVDSVNGGQWQGMVCDHCSCGGYLELLPGDDIGVWKRRFEEELRFQLRLVFPNPAALTLTFAEEYQGHRMAETHPFSVTASKAMDGSWSGKAPPPRLSAFNSGCEAGLRANLQQTPTLVWGPGSLAQAHAIDESIHFSEVKQGAKLFAEFAMLWSGRERVD